MKINWKVRIRHKNFWMGLIGAVLSPITAYFGATPADLTTWEKLVNMIFGTFKNPALLVSVIFAAAVFIGVVTDPTTVGLGDSDRALKYVEPAGKN